MELELSDEQLMERYLGGQSQAFGVLLQRHGPRLFNFIVRQTGDRQLAEDLVQDAFLRVVHRADTFRGQAKFTTWLFQIARNLCIDHGRRQQHRRHRRLDAPLRAGEDGTATLLDRIPHGGPGPDRSAADERFRVRLDEALATLPDDQREVFVMRQLQGMKFADIADVVGAPENTIKSRMRYALQSLRTHLADLGGDLVAPPTP